MNVNKDSFKHAMFLKSSEDVEQGLRGGRGGAVKTQLAAHKGTPQLIRNQLTSYRFVIRWDVRRMSSVHYLVGTSPPWSLSTPSSLPKWRCCNHCTKSPPVTRFNGLKQNGAAAKGRTTSTKTRARMKKTRREKETIVSSSRRLTTTYSSQFSKQGESRYQSQFFTTKVRNVPLSIMGRLFMIPVDFAKNQPHVADFKVKQVPQRLLVAANR